MILRSEIPPATPSLPVEVPPASDRLTSAMREGDIDRGTTGDQVRAYDPGLSRRGTDEEAAGPSAAGVAPTRTERLDRARLLRPARRRRDRSGVVAIARLMKRGPGHSVWVDISVGLTAGLVATLMTNLAQRPLRWMTPESVDRHEKRVRPGASSSLVAAQKLCAAMDLDASPRRHAMSGKAIHLATGMGWGPVYGLLRRYAGLPPVTAALASGTAMSLILDEALVPALGLSAPNHHYPNFTRIRGLVAHLVYGAAVAVAAEGLGRSIGHPPAHRARPSQSPDRSSGR